MKKNVRNWIIVGVVAVAAIVTILLLNRTKEIAVIDTEICEIGVIENTVTATGEIQPVYKVEVGTQVSGIVEKLYVDYNSEVKKGQLLAELDKSVLQEQVKQSLANLNSTKSNKDLAQKSYDRIKTLYEKKAATQEEFDQAESNLITAQNQVITAQSNYDNARTNLKYAEIYSPIDGVVLSKSVEEGQTVASSFSTPTIFTIAKNLTDMQVEADVDEADIGLVKTGQSVRFTVDAFPTDTFSGTVRQIRLEPTVTSNVVTYTVIIDAPNDGGKLYPGMTANISIVVESGTGVITSLEATRLDVAPDMEQFLVEQGYTLRRMQQLDAEAVFVQRGMDIVQVPITVSLSDGANVVVSDGLTQGDCVIRNISREKSKASGERTSANNPLKMGPPEHKKR